MVILNNNDGMQVKLVTLIADYDKETLTNLYQPLIGYAALAIYFSLWSEALNQKVTYVVTHDSFLARMQMTVGEFIKARKSLEAVGLVRTYLEENEQVKLYHYDLYAPKTPDEFFNDALLYGLLIKYIGETDAKNLVSLYSIKKDKTGNEISASFKEVFHPNFEDPAFMKALSNKPSAGRNRAKMALEFSYEKFAESLKTNTELSETCLTKKEFSEIARLSMLYGIDEPKAAFIVANNYNPALEKGKRLDFVSITNTFQEETNYAYLASSFKLSNKHNLVSSSNALASKINMMETLCPKDYLQILQNGTKPALSDLKLLDALSNQFHLNNSVINAVVDYTLAVNHNVLSRAYLEKVCASVVREGCKTTIDTMDYLKSISKKRCVNKNGILKESDVTKNNLNVEEKEDDDWSDLLDELSNGDDNDGEA